MSAKIVEFEKEKKRIEFKNSRYIGSITIYIEGEYLQRLNCKYYLKYIEEYQYEELLNYVYNDLNRKMEESFIENLDSILNKEITIHYYKSVKGKYLYEYEPEDLEDSQIFLLLILCLINIKN